MILTKTDTRFDTYEFDRLFHKGKNKKVIVLMKTELLLF